MKKTPYIKQEKRKQFDVFVNNLAALLDPRDFEGDLNYIITTLIHKLMPEGTWHYADYNRVIGVLECVKFELYRRKIIPFEDQKILSNGDID